MPKKSKVHPKPGAVYHKTFLREWLTHRNKTHDQLAEYVGITRPQVTRIINGKRPYNQEFLEKAAEYLDTDPGSLLMRDPSAPGAIWSLWERASVGQRSDIERLAEVVLSRKNG